jgi:hypothetical protein
MKLPHTKRISTIFLVTAITLILVSSFAEANPIKVSLGLPPSVGMGMPFTIAISVTNQTNATISFNRVAVAYALQDFKIRGPFEVDTAPHSVAANTTATINVTFRILYGNGVIVPLTVVLANNNYTQNSMVGAAAGGVLVTNSNN